MNKLFVVFGLLLMAGCSPTKLYLVHSPKVLHFATPETSGGFAEGNAVVSAGFKEPEYAFGFIDTDYVAAVGSNVANSTQESKRKNGGNLNLLFNLGLLDNLDAYLDIDGTLGLKVQLLGESKLAKSEGLKLSLSAKYGHYVSHKSELNSLEAAFLSLFTLGSSAYTETTTKRFDIATNIGYRYSSNHLAYINTFISREDFSGKLWSDRVSIYRTVQTSSQTEGVLLGYEYTTDSDTFYILEAGASHTSWSNRGDVWSFPFGLSYGRSW